MSQTAILFFRDKDGTVPYFTWLDTVVDKRDKRVRAKCEALLQILRDKGHNVRRPQGDYLRDGIYELRTKFGGANYRTLYFFHDTYIAVVSHGLIKEDIVPNKEIELAIKRKALFETDPMRYSHES